MSDDRFTQPPGFLPWPAVSNFMMLLGDLFAQHDAAGDIVLGMRVGPSHLNHQQAMHGGMVATLADHVMNHRAARANAGPVVTAHLGVDYLGRVPANAWLEVESRIDRQGKRMLFMACIGSVGGAPVFRANAIFSALGR